jgi:hypothetical protein
MIYIQQSLSIFGAILVNRGDVALDLLVTGDHGVAEEGQHINFLQISIGVPILHQSREPRMLLNLQGSKTSCTPHRHRSARGLVVFVLRVGDLDHVLVEQPHELGLFQGFFNFSEVLTYEATHMLRLGSSLDVTFKMI